MEFPSRRKTDFSVFLSTGPLEVPSRRKTDFPFFVDWALQGGASKPRPSNFLSTGIVDWAGWYLVLSTGLAGSHIRERLGEAVLLRPENEGTPLSEGGLLPPLREEYHREGN